MGKRFKQMKLGLFALIMMLSISGLSIKATNEQVYTCVVNRYYKHPVTGVIEDSGGQASFEIGQGMVEGSIDSTGIIEQTANDQYYLTFKIKLMDFTKNHSFSVQKRGSSSWSPTKGVITGRGKGTNGSTANISLTIPNKDAIVRGTMYVTAMGRQVVWYMSPSNLISGNKTGMKASHLNQTKTQTNQVNQNTQTGETNNKQVTSEENVKTDASLSNAQGLTLSTMTKKEEKDDSISLKEAIIINILSIVGAILALGLVFGIIAYFIIKKKGKANGK